MFFMLINFLRQVIPTKFGDLLETNERITYTINKNNVKYNLNLEGMK